MARILSQSGTSVADVYDVEGSVAGVDELVSREVSLVHEMSGTIFSERLGGTIIRVATGAIAQSTTWDIVITTDLPPVPFRILGIYCFAGQARVETCNVSLREEATSRELPLYVFDTAQDITHTARIRDDGAAATNVVLFGPAAAFNLPSLGLGIDQAQPLASLSFRGASSAFGAGTVTVVAVIAIAFATREALSSRGLPIPGW